MSTQLSSSVSIPASIIPAKARRNHCGSKKNKAKSKRNLCMMAYSDSDPAEEVLRGWELEDARAAGDLFSCVDESLVLRVTPSTSTT